LVTKQISDNEIFNKIYEYERWVITRNDTLSGSGSNMINTKKTIQIVLRIVMQYNIKSMYDCACGDLTWMPTVLTELLRQNKPITYIGGDVSSVIIKKNIKQKVLASIPNTYLKTINFVNDKLPDILPIFNTRDNAPDIILCRDVLQHLNHLQVITALVNFSKSGSKFLLATNYINQSEKNSEIDISVGKCNSRNLYNKPISLPTTDIECHDEYTENKYLCMWKLPFDKTTLSMFNNYISKHSTNGGGSTKKKSGKKSVKKKSIKKSIKKSGKKSIKKYITIVDINPTKLDIKNIINEYKTGEVISTQPYSDTYYMAVNKKDHLIQKMLKKGYLFEIYSTMMLNSYTSHGDVFIDVGANIGTMSIPMSKSVGSTGLVYSFEPFNDTFKILAYNAFKNNCANIRLINSAAGHKITTTTLSNKAPLVTITGTNAFTVSTSNIKTSKLIELGGVKIGDGGQSTNMITIDSLNLKKLSILKVDVEGAENIVFSGALKSIKKFKPIIMFEANWVKLSPDMIRILKLPDSVIDFDIIDFCRKLGYTKIFKSPADDYMIVSPDRLPTKNDKMVKFEKVNKLELPMNTDGFELYKFIKPKW
jgi:FkbM family methyltransferase